MLVHLHLHLRPTVPTDLADAVVEPLRHDDRSANLTHHVGASLSPVGGIVVTTPTSTPFTDARRLERAAPGDPDDAVIWDTVIEQCYAASRATISYYLFFVRQPARGTRGDHRLGRAGDRRDGGRSRVRHRRSRGDRPGLRPPGPHREGAATAGSGIVVRSWWSPCSASSRTSPA